MGENPVSNFPRPSLVRQALASLEFLVVIDMFLTETAKLATVVLPAASFAEKEGTFTNFEGRVQRVRRAIKPMGNCLPDWEIILQLANRMGHRMPYSSPQQVMDEISELVPLYQRLAYADFQAEDMDWAELESGRSAKRLYGGLFPSGFGRFSAVEYIPPIDNSRDVYPFTLVAGSVLQHFGSGTRSLRASRLKKFAPQAWVEISEPDARQLGFGDGDAVRIVSPTGEVKTSLRVSGTLPSGMLFMPISFPDNPVYELFDVALDPRSKAPSIKSCAVRLERATVNG